MIRKWIPIKQLEIFDSMHFPDGDGFTVDAAKDGKTTEEHREGIDYIKSVLEKGQKIMPILARDNGDGTFQRLDGFKKCWAHKELGIPYIEAFVCSNEEYGRVAVYPYGKAEIRCYHGGLPKEDYPLFEGGERPDFKYDEVEFLFKSPNHYGLRIEACENLQIHWGDYGRYRLGLGRRDFEELAKAIISIEL